MQKKVLIYRPIIVIETTQAIFTNAESKEELRNKNRDKERIKIRETMQELNIIRKELGDDNITIRLEYATKRLTI